MTATERQFCKIARAYADCIADIRRYQAGERFVPSGPLRVYGVPSNPSSAISLQTRYAAMYVSILQGMWAQLDANARQRVYEECTRKRAA
jgi:hypothetical protein